MMITIMTMTTMTMTTMAMTMTMMKPFFPRLPDMMIFDTRLIIVIINYDDDEDFENDYINQDYNIKIIWK